MDATAVLLYLMLSLGAATLAHRSGRDFFLWWLYALALLIVALPHALLLEPDEEALERRAHVHGRRRCPWCARLIGQAATVCPCCTRDVPAWTGGGLPVAGGARADAIDRAIRTGQRAP